MFVLPLIALNLKPEFLTIPGNCFQSSAQCQDYHTFPNCNVPKRNLDNIFRDLKQPTFQNRDTFHGISNCLFPFLLHILSRSTFRTIIIPKRFFKHVLFLQLIYCGRIWIWLCISHVVMVPFIYVIYMFKYSLYGQVLFPLDSVMEFSQAHHVMC